MSIRPNRNMVKDYKYVITLRNGRKFFEAIASACVSVLLSNEKEKEVEWVVPSKTRYPITFPRGWLQSDDGVNEIRRNDAKRMLTWLYDHNFSAVSLSMIYGMKISHTKRSSKVVFEEGG